ncbi:MAG: hypothetical protein WCO69_00560 [Candidatus Omnitrophota bacterium]
MNSIMHGVADVGRMINEGKALILAGDEALLKQLPRGNWVGGTTPYFISPEGGVISRDKIFVTELPDDVQQVAVQSYDDRDIDRVYADAPANGFTFLILPAGSPVHLAFALKAPQFPDFGMRPLVGWISGVYLPDLGKVSPKTLNGMTGELSDRHAVVMRVELKHDRVCDMGIVNIFKQGDGDVYEVFENTFSAGDVLINGQRANLAEHAVARKLDTRLPLVADFCGAMINVSFQSVDEKGRMVNFYAPLLKGLKYRQAAPCADYVGEFTRQIPKDDGHIVFSCNCILNFIHSELEGKKTGGIVGPITFGEVAYQLLNQTMVYLTVHKI